MNTYEPDFWTILFLNFDKEPHYRVFGSWSGGYTSGDKWKMNSGIVKVELIDNHYHFHGASGSVYICHKDGYGANTFGSGIIKQYIDHHGALVIQVMNKDTDWLNVDWMISK